MPTATARRLCPGGIFLAYIHLYRKLHRVGYWFDYGDDWWHQVDVQAIDEKMPRGKYPKVIKRVGKSPPQYMDEED